MASDYKRIAEENRVRYGSDPEYRRFFYEQLYKEKTHFVYELIQNAVDSKSCQLELRLKKNEIFVWNDGDQFSEKDVRSICSLGSSSKDLTQIGTFGIGFKSVYNYTDYPEIYSDDESFRILDLTQPEGINNMMPQIVEQVNKGRTAFRLPFKDDLSQEDIELLKDQFCKLGERWALLFLRDLERDFKRDFKTIKWIDECDGQTGICSCNRHPHRKIRNASEIELTMSLNGENQLSEMFLVFHKTVQPSPDVIDALLKQTKHDEKRQKIQQSAKKRQPIEIAFKLHDGSITEMDDNCVLFAYLPTQKGTHLKFLIQARYQTTSGRADIQDPSENPWNRWLVQETAKFLPEILEQLKAGDLLEPSFFNILPLSGDDKVRTDDKVPLEFEPIVKVLEDAMGEKPLVPTQDGGYAKAENVFYPESTPLRKLVKSSGMHSDSSLLHPYIRKDAKESERCFDVMAKAGVREIDAGDLLCWLEKQSLDWFKKRTYKWMRSLYVYFNRKWSESEWERIRKIPLVRLENGEHARVSKQLVYFPPDTDEAREDIGPFLNELPILRSTLLKGEDHSHINAFLKKLGVKMLRSRSLIIESICPLYSQPNKPAIMKNRRHVRYIFKSWQKAAESERSRLEESVSKVPILRAYKGIQRESFDFVVPRSAYLSQAYTGDNDLETYFSVSNNDLWFVDDKYLKHEFDTEMWFQFLKAIGSRSTPRVIQKKISRTSESYANYQKFNAELTKRNIELEYTTRWWETNVEDRYLQGLSEVLDKVKKYGEVDLSRTIWQLLVKIVSPLPSETWNQNTFFINRFQGIYRWFYRTNQRKFFDAAFYRQLKEIVWLFDEQGNLRLPSECFAPINGNREVLGDSVPYLHPNFDVGTRPTRWLAGKLGIHLQADADGVLDYLKILRQTEASIEKVKPIYKFFSLKDVPLQKFETEPLIFTPEPEPRWWRIDEVFWENESEVFGNARGYLKAYYSEDLESFFTTSLGVPKRADSLDYVRRIQEIASAEKVEDVKVRERVKILYNCLWQSLRKGDSLLASEEWEQMRAGRCWLGKKGSEWDFFFLHELVWKDDDYRSRLLKDKIPFSTFDSNLLEFAKYLGVKGCYEVSDVEVECYSNQGEDQIWSEKVKNLYPYICDFLNSPRLCEEYGEGKPAEVLNRLSVCQAEKLEVRYKLKGISVPDPNPRQSFLEKTRGTLWLGLEEDKEAYPDLIGDALQDHFGTNQLREFTKDLLLTDFHKTTLLGWERRGFKPNFCLLPSESDSEENEDNSSESVDERLPDETGGKNDSETNNSESETPTVHEDPETGCGESDSTTDVSDTPMHRPRPDRSDARWHSGSGRVTPNRNRGAGYSRSGGGGGEGEDHLTLKKYLADNPSLFGEGLELVDTEYRFRSGDEADILFEDGSGNPITVEVKPPILSGSDQEVWQAVKYKHLAAVKYKLPCEQVRSILAAPEIPDDVKEKCQELGIEPFEVSQR